MITAADGTSNGRSGRIAGAVSRRDPRVERARCCAFAALFADDAVVIGFDGSSMDGRADLQATLERIFADHPTAPYITRVRSVRMLGPGVALVRAYVRMVPPGRSDINPDLNAVQTMIATKGGGGWRVAMFQNTPAAFHGRSDLSRQLTAELREELTRKL